MNKLIIFPILFSIIACTSKNEQQQQQVVIDTTPSPIFLNQLGPLAPDSMEDPYKILFNIESTKDDKHDLIIAMELEEGSFFVSPFAVRDFKGKFNVSLEENKYLSMDSTFTETPRSEEIFDPHPFVSGAVNWVSVNTKYQYQLNLLKEEDFKIKGVVRFVIEPRCTLEEVTFEITYEAGKMKIKGMGGC